MSFENSEKLLMNYVISHIFFAHIMTLICDFDFLKLIRIIIVIGISKKV